MKQQNTMGTLFIWLLTLVDLSLIMAAAAAAWYVRFQTDWLGAFQEGAQDLRHYWYASPVVLLVFWVVFKYIGLYRQRRGISSVAELSRIINGSLLSLTVLTALAFFNREFQYSIKVVLMCAAGSALLISLWRGFFRQIQISLRRKGIGVARTIVVGSGETALKMISRIGQHPGMGYRVTGFVDDITGANAKQFHPQSR